MKIASIVAILPAVLAMQDASNRNGNAMNVPPTNKIINSDPIVRAILEKCYDKTPNDTSQRGHLRIQTYNLFNYHYTCAVTQMSGSLLGMVPEQHKLRTGNDISVTFNENEVSLSSNCEKRNCKVTFKFAPNSTNPNVTEFIANPPLSRVVDPKATGSKGVHGEINCVHATLSFLQQCRAFINFSTHADACVVNELKEISARSKVETKPKSPNDKMPSGNTPNLSFIVDVKHPSSATKKTVDEEPVMMASASQSKEIITQQPSMNPVNLSVNYQQSQSTIFANSQNPNCFTNTIGESSSNMNGNEMIIPECASGLDEYDETYNALVQQYIKFNQISSARGTVNQATALQCIKNRLKSDRRYTNKPVDQLECFQIEENIYVMRQLNEEYEKKTEEAIRNRRGGNTTSPVNGSNVIDYNEKRSRPADTGSDVYETRTSIIADSSHQAVRVDTRNNGNANQATQPIPNGNAFNPAHLDPNALNNLFNMLLSNYNNRPTNGQ